MNLINDYESKIIENWPNLQKSCQVSINNFNNKYAGQILAECLTDSIIINPKSGDEYYIYHPTQKLWIKYTRKLLETNICSSLLEFIFRHYLKTNNPQEKKISNIITKCGQRSFIKQSWDYAESILILQSDNTGRYSILNRGGTLLPLANQDVFDLEVQGLRPRAKGDYFTYFLPISYQSTIEEHNIKIYNMILSAFGGSTELTTEFLKISASILFRLTPNRRLFVFFHSHTPNAMILMAIVKTILKTEQNVLVAEILITPTKIKKLLNDPSIKIIIWTSNINLLLKDICLQSQIMLLNIPRIEASIGTIDDQVALLSTIISAVKEYHKDGLKWDLCLTLPQNLSVEDICHKFIEERCNIDLGNCNLRCNVTLLYETFVDWFKERYSHGKIYDQQNIQDVSEWNGI